MLLKYFYDPALAHASYLVGCQRTGEAVVVDPGRDVEGYLTVAAQEEMRIVGVAETHIHADYVSGARELAARVGAKLFVSDEGGSDWSYQYAAQYPRQLLKDGDRFRVGNLLFEAMHTPGHTPEHISFLLTDQGGGATEPMGLFTGDFVFVGSVGRPDLLEKAVGALGTAEAGAQRLFHSLERFKQLPDFLQVWPTHGAGSACGKGLGAVPSSTVGYEKRFNPALQFEDEGQFVRYLLADQPEVPPYFAVMKRVNKVGPALLAETARPVPLAAEELVERVQAGQIVVDTRAAATFAAAHVPGTLNLPLAMLGEWAGWLLPYERLLHLIIAQEALPEALRLLHKLGIDNVVAFFEPDEVAAAGLNGQHYEDLPPAALAEPIRRGEMVLVDVRSEEEWNEGHLPHAQHIMLGTLPQRAAEVVNGKPIVLQCRSGVRAALAASIVQAAGATRVINMAGGYRAWAAAGLPIER